MLSINKPEIRLLTSREILALCEKPQIRPNKNGMLLSGAKFKPNTTRANENVDEISIVGLDFDHNANWEADLQILRDYNIAFIAYTSHSNLRYVPAVKGRTRGNPNAEPRFRVFIFLNQPIPANKYPMLFRFFFNLTGKKIDTAASDCSRMFFAPAKATKDAPYNHQKFIGEPFDWTTIDFPEDDELKVEAKTASARVIKHNEDVDEPPKNKLRDLIEFEPKFRASWNKKRTELDDNNQSSIDLSLANYAALNDWTDKEILSLLVKSRGDFKRNERDQVRWDYYERTIAEARRWAVKESAKNEQTTIENNAVNKGVAVEKSVAINNIVSIEECNDIGNARRFVNQHGSDLRYCVEQKRWFIYDGQRWQIDSTLKVNQLAKQTALSIAVETLLTDDGKLQDQLLKHAQKTKHAKGIKDMLSLAESEIPIKASDFDKDTWLLNCNNGTLDLRTGRLREHRREDFITKLVKVDYDATAKCPTWLAFLSRIMNGNEQLISFLRRAIGYSLTGEVNERAVFVLYGNGANGKSVFVEIFLTLLDDYAVVAPPSAVMKKRENSATNDVARLKGARFASVNETEENGRIDESAIKAMSGDDKLTARFLYAEFFQFNPQFKLWLRTNHKPTVRGTDEGIWDRLKLIHFAVRIPKHEQNKNLMKELQKELSGILAWAMQGCLDWRINGLGVPYEVEQATNEYREEQNSFAQFIGSCCIIGKNKWASSASLRSEYESYCKERGETPHLTGNAFATSLRALGCEQKSNGKARGWAGIGLLISH